MAFPEQKDESEAALPASAEFEIKKNGRSQIEKGTLDLSSGTATLSATLDEPGTLLLIVKGDGIKKSLAGAAFSAESIGLSLSKPDDFNAFWKEKLASMTSIPLNPVLTPTESPVSEIELSEVSLDNIWDTKVRGQIAVKKDLGPDAEDLVPESFPIEGQRKNVLHILTHCF